MPAVQEQYAGMPVDDTIDGIYGIYRWTGIGFLAVAGREYAVSANRGLGLDSRAKHFQKYTFCRRRWYTYSRIHPLNPESLLLGACRA